MHLIVPSSNTLYHLTCKIFSFVNRISKGEKASLETKLNILKGLDSLNIFVHAGQFVKLKKYKKNKINYTSKNEMQ